MTAPSLTNPSILNSDISDVTKLTQNDNDLLNAITDGTKDLEIANITINGTLYIYAGGINYNDPSFLFGDDASSADFTAKLISSYGDTGVTSTSLIGLVGEALANVSSPAIGVVGAGKTSSATTGTGVKGYGKVAAATDAVRAYGGYFVSDGTHTGADNVGAYVEASNASGTGKNIALYVGGGLLKLAVDSSIVDLNANELIKFTQTTSAVNEITIANAATLGLPKMVVTGGDTDIGIEIESKGAGNILLDSASGYVQFGTYSAGAATDSTGYITIQDAAGNTRKLMVQA